MSLNFPTATEGLDFTSDNGTVYVFEDGAWRVQSGPASPNTVVSDGPGISVSQSKNVYTVSTDIASLLDYQGRVDLTDKNTIPDTSTLSQGDSFVNSGSGAIVFDWNAEILQDITEDVRPLDVVSWNETESKFDYYVARDQLLPNLQEVTNIGTHTTHSITLGGDNVGDAKVVLQNDGNCSAVNFLSTSDIALKENITVVEDAMSTLKEIEGVKFDWKETGKSTLGIVAQNVETVLPELVVENNGTKSVNYNGLIGLLIEAVKEQQKQIDELGTSK